VRPGILEIVLLVIVLLFIFGARRLPEIGRGLGSGFRSFKEGVTGKDELEPGEPPSD
jgi:sec-independent protein translocase protein TatA